MTLLVTGCAGFIGARTAQLALDDGHEVVGLDNLNDYYDPLLKRHRLEGLLANKSFRFLELDIEDGAALERVFAVRHFDAVINLAARAGVRASIELPHLYMHTNTVATLNLLERMARYNVPKFVIASTSSLYAGLPMPFTEDALVTRPISPYAATKLAAEALAHVWHHLHGIDVSVLRYFTVYGPAGRPDMAPFRFSEWIRRGQPITLYGDGTQTRDFTYIDDIARGTLAALKPLGYEIINLGGGNTPVTVNAMIEALELHLGRPAVIQHEAFQSVDMRDTSAEIGKARTLLGWEPLVPPDEGFRKTAEWHRAEHAWLDKVQL
ncbi:SDR family NAD(P)-dependent oxidoreductase [Luteolibacter marinus]|uniref:SDR family NAD(P)-dependent oxidoreductase n=1 Tax=Luteolibacter marinus TaxID=2776705 RepID=UPI001865B01A|nr:SDR family NAD(P)-dependent oxidoreductase [Luteolibacter marinus]